MSEQAQQVGLLEAVIYCCRCGHNTSGVEIGCFIIYLKLI